MPKRPVAVVIGDDTDIRELIVTVLGMCGCVVHAAESADGVGSVRLFGPDITILDTGYGDTDGVETARKIRAFSDAYILVLTTHPGARAAAKGLTAVGHMLKPFRVDELRTHVRSVLDVAPD